MLCGRVETQERDGELQPNDFEALHDERLLSDNKRETLDPARRHIRQHQRVDAAPRRGATVVNDEVSFAVAGPRIIPVPKGAHL